MSDQPHQDDLVVSRSQHRREQIDPELRDAVHADALRISRIDRHHDEDDDRPGEFDDPTAVQPTDWPPAWWHSVPEPACPTVAVALDRLRHEATALELLASIHRDGNQPNLTPGNQRDAILKAYKLLRSLRERNLTAVEDDDPTLQRDHFDAYTASQIIRRLHDRIAAPSPRGNQSGTSQGGRVIPPAAGEGPQENAPAPALTDQEYKILAAIKKERASLSVAKLAKAVDLSDRQTFRWVQRLQKKKYIRSVRGCVGGQEITEAGLAALAAHQNHG
jgi:hypothetical protein